MLETKKGFKKGKILIPKSKNSRKTIDYTKKKKIKKKFDKSGAADGFLSYVIVKCKWWQQFD